MTSLRELMTHLEDLAPLHIQESYDNSGLLYGSPDWQVTGVLCCLDATEAIIREAKERHCNVVVSHHPIVFRGIRQINLGHYVDKALVYAIKHDVALYAIHTNLDNVLKNGVSQHIANRLQLANVHLLDPKPGDCGTGTGILGEMKAPMSIDEFLPWLKMQMNTSCIRHTQPTSGLIQKLAITGGSGAPWIRKAIQEGADAYITGDIKYHEFFEANDEIMICDVGHYESEQFTIELIARLISEKFSNFAAHCTKLNTNPVQYF